MSATPIRQRNGEDLKQLNVSIPGTKLEKLKLISIQNCLSVTQVMEGLLDNLLSHPELLVQLGLPCTPLFSAEASAGLFEGFKRAKLLRSSHPLAVQMYLELLRHEGIMVSDETIRRWERGPNGGRDHACPTTKVAPDGTKLFRCSTCKDWKPAGHYTKSKRWSRGVQFECKACARDRYRARTSVGSDAPEAPQAQQQPKHVGDAEPAAESAPIGQVA